MPEPVPPPADGLLLLGRRVLADALGTFALVFAGCGAVVVGATRPGTIDHLGVSAAFGVVVAAMIFAVGHISGAHLNPAVSVAFAAMGRFPWREVPAYVLGQVLGAIGAAWAVRALFGDAASLGATVPAVPLVPALALEALLTFFLRFVIAAVATDSRAQGQLAAVAVGGTVGLLALVGGPATGASMNPARTLGPAVASGELTGLWIYLVAPVVGAVLGAWTYQLVAWRPDLDRT
jgi:aquaporin NIP